MLFKTISVCSAGMRLLPPTRERNTSASTLYSRNITNCREETVTESCRCLPSLSRVRWGKKKK